MTVWRSLEKDHLQKLLLLLSLLPNTLLLVKVLSEFLDHFKASKPSSFLSEHLQLETFLVRSFTSQNAHPPLPAAWLLLHT